MPYKQYEPFRTLAGDRPEKGYTSLHAAAKNCQLSLAKRLIKRGVKLSVVDDSGRTPIHYAIENDDIEMTDLLSANGATGSKEQNMLHVAVRQGRQTIVRRLLYRGVNIDAKEPDGKTALHAAIELGLEAMFEILIEYGADIYARDNEGRTPLHTAVKSGHFCISKFLVSIYEEIDQTDVDGKTALHLASQYRRFSIIDILLGHEPDINLTCKAGKTAIEYYNSTRFESSLIARYAMTMLALGRPVSDRNLTAMRKRLHFDMDYQRCAVLMHKEIKLMKNSNIGGSKLSYYDVLTSHVHRLASYARNKNIRAAIKSGKYKQAFYWYAALIDNRIQKAIRRNDFLLYPSLKVLSAFSNYVLSDDTTGEILSYLSNMDLNNLIKAGSRSKNPIV